MTTKLNVGDTVYLPATVEGITIRKDETNYDIRLDRRVRDDKGSTFVLVFKHPDGHFLDSSVVRFFAKIPEETLLKEVAYVRV